jgi:hypothetical protein
MLVGGANMQICKIAMSSLSHRFTFRRQIVGSLIGRIKMAINFKSPIEELVDRLFSEINAKRGDQCVNPVTGGHFIWGDDPIAPQKSAAVKALRAREWFATNGPPGAPILPLSHRERENLKVGGLSTVVALYARSLESRDYDTEEHPSFDDFACGVMASDFNGHLWMKEDVELRRRFPPRPLKGLGPGLMWLPPKEHAEIMAIYNRSTKIFGKLSLPV